MITPSPEDYGFVQVERPVIAGSGEFLARAALVGRRVLGTEIATSVTEFGFTEVTADTVLEEPTYQVRGIERDVMHVGDRNDLRVVLLHRGAPPELASRHSFGYHAGLLAAHRRTVRGRIHPDEPERGKHLLPCLTTELNQISQDLGQKPNYMPLIFDQITILDEPGKDLVLGLLPKARQIGTLVLHRQAQAAFRRLATQSKRLAFPTSPGMVAIPFARIPGTIKEQQYERLMEGLEGHLPHTFVLGGIDYPSKDRSPED